MGTANSSERNRRWKQRKRQEWAAGLKIPCICGCGTLIPAINALGKPARYAWGHNPGGEATRFIKGQIAHNKGKPNPKAVEIHKGKTLSPAELAQRTATRFAKYGAYHSPDGMRRILTRSPKWYEHLVQALRQRDYTGAKNPFYGKTHSPESRALLILKLSGPNNPNWNGGVATLPYGPEFTRRFKRLIRERDGNKCQRCNITRKASGHMLQVHHIDHDKTNNDPSNLVTICNSCNVYLSYHREESLISFPKRRMFLH